MEAPEDSSTPRNPPIVAPKPTPQRRDLSSLGQTLDLDTSSSSAAPDLSTSRRANLSRQNAFEDVNEESPLSPGSNASTQDIVDAIALNTMEVTKYIGALADRVKDLETSVSKST